MKLTFLGTGGGLCSTKNNFHSNVVIEQNNKKLLIDCGSHCPQSLEEQNISVTDLVV